MSEAACLSCGSLELRFLECAEHGRECELVICSECGE